uniref:Uncharacterized protein n=1 Tax=Cacopsylla melanoneura TaxID=428564 RepID=A0A8D9BDE4_9HEMI
MKNVHKEISRMDSSVLYLNTPRRKPFIKTKGTWEWAYKLHGDSSSGRVIVKTGRGRGKTAIKSLEPNHSDSTRGYPNFNPSGLSATPTFSLRLKEKLDTETLGNSMRRISRM